MENQFAIERRTMQKAGLKCNNIIFPSTIMQLDSDWIVSG